MSNKTGDLCSSEKIFNPDEILSIANELVKSFIQSSNDFGLSLGEETEKQKNSTNVLINRTERIIQLLNDSRNLLDGNTELCINIAEKLINILTLSIKANQEHKKSTQEYFDTITKQSEIIKKQANELLSIQEKIMIDCLTNIGNRLAYIGEFNDLLNLYYTKGKTFSLAILDLDHFKKVNDTRGHNLGDAVLILFSRIITKSIGNSQTSKIFRIGGEEFGMLCKGDKYELSKQIERARTVLINSRIKNVNNGSLITDLKITFSAGVDSVTKGDNADTLSSRVDALLYKAKENGRNQTCIG